MLTITNWQNLSLEEQQLKLARPIPLRSCQSQVQDIINAVKAKGDAALLNFTREFDCVDLQSLTVSEETIQSAEISKQAFDAINQAIRSIRIYNQAILPKEQTITTAKGIIIERLYRPIAKVGLYIPGGNNTPLVSSLLMQAIPALVAGCPLKVLCTPPNRYGQIDPHLLVAARLCEIDTIYPIGGAQAIAAMAYGTETIKKMDKLFGPGNSYVTEAKTLVAADPSGAAIDMPAGPSEVMVLADNQANPDFVAADLMAQAEHGVDSQVILVCDSVVFAEKVRESLTQQFQWLSRQSIIEKALQSSAIIVCDNRSAQIEIVNSYAPEHLIINRTDANDWVSEITAAGTIFLGQWAAETMGDYVTGSNHVIPTNGNARAYSALSIFDFLKTINVQSIDEEGLAALGQTAQILADLEGLDAHANAVKIRLKQLEF